MNLTLARELSSRILAFTGILSVMLTKEISSLLAGAVMASVGLSIIQIFQKQEAWISKKTWNILNVMALIYFVFDFLILSRSLLISITHFSMLLLLNKLFNLLSEKDHFQLQLISLLLLLAASTLTTNISFAVSFVLFLLAAIWALLLHYLSTQEDPLKNNPRTETLSLHFFTTTTLMAIVILGTTVVLFFMFPRIGIGILNRDNSDLIRVSGFSEEVDLGEIGPVKSDPTVIMRAKLSWQGNPNPLPSLYWKGKVFDYFDGEAWKNIIPSRSLTLRNIGGRFLVRPYRRGLPILNQEIMLEPLDSSVLLTISQPNMVSGLFTGLRSDALQNLNLLHKPSTRLSYRASSQVPILQKVDQEIKALQPPPPIQNFYLRLPPRSGRITNLAKSVTESGTTVYERVLLIEQFLETNYRYSLNVKPSVGERPIEDFLFNQKEGYCEQYATAMALMLRSIGIPSRLATGFLLGDYNPYGKYFTVRNSDAHAWVEVWFPRSGWIPFDPTPSDLGEDTGFVLSELSHFLDSLNFTWNRYFVSYTIRDQISAVQTVGRGGFLWVEKMESLLKTGVAQIKNISSPMGKWGGGLILVLIPVVLFLALRFRSSPTRWIKFFMKRGDPDRKSQTEFYTQLLKILKTRGLVKRNSITPLEFCKQLKEEWLTDPVTALTLFYYRVRFGNLALTQGEMDQIEKTLLDLQTPPDQGPSH